jgi:predicted nuclease with TOPRIM domain
LNISQVTLCDTTELEKELETLITEMYIVAEQIQGIIAENSRMAQDQAEYERKYNILAEKYESIKTAYDDKSELIKKKQAQAKRFKGFIKTLENTGN